jgi:small glutamine-rich tetratricopeptide repeat-containing protein alpha
MAEQRETIYAIIEYLNCLKASGTNEDTIDTVVGLLESEFSIATTPETFAELSTFPLTLPEVITAGKKALGFQQLSTSLEAAKGDPKYATFCDAVIKRGYFEGAPEGSMEWYQRSARLLQKYRQKVQGSGPSKAELEQKAEEAKLRGNAAISAKDFDGAIAAYTEALTLSSDGPNSHVYYSNRAAAYCYQSKYQESVNDCLSSVTLAPDYVKAYSRLGLSYFFLEQYAEAVDAYEKAAELEPDNKATQDSLRQARSKLKKVKSSTSSSQPLTAASGEDIPGLPGGAAGLGGMMDNPAMKRALDQMGGPSALAGMMKDPNMMAMAQQMMKDPAMMQQAMSMFGGAGGGGDGGMPDMSALAGMMGALGGAGPGIGAPRSSSSSSSTVPSSSSSKGGKKQFKGFEE